MNHTNINSNYIYVKKKGKPTKTWTVRHFYVLKKIKGEEISFNDESIDYVFERNQNTVVEFLNIKQLNRFSLQGYQC